MRTTLSAHVHLTKNLGRQMLEVRPVWEGNQSDGTSASGRFRGASVLGERR